MEGEGGREGTWRVRVEGRNMEGEGGREGTWRVRVGGKEHGG